MVLKNGSVKVMDFGIARLISHGNTLTKEALGSVHYISPEQARGGRIDDRSDIYSLGVVMYEMMAGRPPYDGESPVAVAIQHINGGASLPSLLNPNIPGGLEQIIMKAMARNLSDRYPSATRMLSDMDEFRKDPTMLFDYTGLPMDAALRVQKVMNEKESAQQAGMPELTPRGGSVAVTRTPQKPATPPQQPPRRKPQQSHKQPHQQKRRPRGPSRGTIVAIAVCTVVAVIAIGIIWWLWFGDRDKEINNNLVIVPKLVGQEYAKVCEEYTDLTIKKEDVHHENVPAGQIISQKIAAGKEVVKNTWIEVEVSVGPAPKVVLMPDLQDQTKEDALKALEDLGFSENITIKEEENESVKKGTIIRTTPQKETALTEGMAITLTVSMGKKMQRVPMPNVVGITEESAKKTLENQGLDLQIVVESVYNPSIEAGLVIESIPGPTEIVATNDKVTLKVSRGVEMKKMPNVVGMNLADAKTKLADTGFKSTPVIQYVAGKEAADTVLTQLPEVDKEYELDVEITLEVSDGSLAPKPVKKTVVIDLKGHAMASGCVVSVKRDGVEVLEIPVPKGTSSVEIPDQEGLGTVYYSVVIDDSDGWLHTENFVEAPESTEPTEGTAAPTEGTAAPTEGTVAPTEGTVAPTDATTAPTTPTEAPEATTANG